MAYTVRVPASASNLGAGFDCLGLALDIWLEARLVPGRGMPRYSGTVTDLASEPDLIRATVARAGLLDDHHLEVNSDIPIGRGLGSSAAAIVAASVLTTLVRGDRVDRPTILAEAIEVEGHPDNAGPAVYGGLILAAQRAAPLPVHPEVGIALAIPDQAIETNVARTLLPDQVTREVAVSQAARAAALTTGMMTGNEHFMSFGMEDLIAEPHRRGLISGYEDAVDAGKEAGAYGVTISGSGSTMIALCPKSAAGEVAAAMTAELGKHSNPAEAVTPEICTSGFKVTENG